METRQTHEGRPDGDAPARLQGLGLGQTILWGIAFLVLTVGIFWYQFSRIQPGDASPRWDQLQWGYLALILLCLPVETVASALRIWLLCKILHPGIRFWTCIKAEWANVALSVLTPSQSGGGPGQVYILNRGGASVGTALTISLLSFVGTMVGLLGLGLYSLLDSDTGATGPLFPGAVGTLTAISSAMLLAVVWPGLFRGALGLLSRALCRLGKREDRLRDWWPPRAPRVGPPVDRMSCLAARLADLVYSYRDDVRRFLRVGKATFVGVCLLSLVFLVSRALMAVLCVRFLGIHAPALGGLLSVQMALIFLIFFAPTPGGAGLAEGASLSIMAGIVPVGFAPYYNMLWRFSTVYLAAMAGLFCLLCALMQDVRKTARSRPGPLTDSLPDDGRNRP